VGRDGSTLALDGQVDRFDRDCVAHEPLRFRPDQDLARVGVLLEARRDVDGVARCERLALADHHFARVDTDAHLELERCDGLAHLDRRAHGPQRIVLVRGGDAEHRHHRVADELLDRAPVAFEHLTQRGVVALHRRPVGLRIEALAERRRSGEVAEEDGDRLAQLPGACLRLQRGPAGAAEPESFPILLPAIGADGHGIRA
jgi:hypothetical protein